ncbi:DUF6368 family protein [Streptomyces cavernicola]|uniref:DUF6368 family protein n=1 Tax=Streptomyces cavernicola TaxID=3043613 RepID=A0ABT6SB97_9ACTN|nr:DUF6368 family protein [Streptomyces sp. B-S-A6]MDI3405049.1 DUF6368 family protein [Streptomyces sp. B-S-A6]
MSGPVVVIELVEGASPASVQRVRELLVRCAARCRETGYGQFDAHVDAVSLGSEQFEDRRSPRPVVVSFMGPGIGDEAVFEAEHAEDSDLEGLIGFTPTHAVQVVALCGSPVDHVVTALLTAAVMDVVGGVAGVELREEQISGAAGLVGVVAVRSGPCPVVFGSARFLRELTRSPGLRFLQ